MVSARYSLTAILCLIYVPQITSAFLRKTTLYKRFGQLPGAPANVDITSSRLLFTEDGFQPETTATKYGSVVLECEVAGSPPPTIHWLKNGFRIVQGYSRNNRDDRASYEVQGIKAKNMLRMSSTRSKLFLDCLNQDDEAEYTCVAENSLAKNSRTTYLTVENPESFMYPDVRKCVGKHSKRGEPARIYMYTVSRMEFENNKVQLFCRAQGSPRPTITWYSSNNKPIEDDDNHKTASNGDLIIRDITWLNMDAYYCVAENIFGTDTSETFLYPVKRGENFGFL